MRYAIAIISGIVIGFIGLWFSSIGLIASLIGSSSSHWLFWMMLQLLSVGVFLTALAMGDWNSKHDE